MCLMIIEGFSGYNPDSHILNIEMNEIPDMNDTPDCLGKSMMGKQYAWGCSQINQIMHSPTNPETAQLDLSFISHPHFSAQQDIQ